jgi:hypothetical protein
VLFGVLQSPLEALNLASGVHQALFASEKRMARGANVDVQILFRRVRLPGVATTTRDRGHFVFGMDASFHFRSPMLPRKSELRYQKSVGVG